MPTLKLITIAGAASKWCVRTTVAGAPESVSKIVLSSERSRNNMPTLKLTTVAGAASKWCVATTVAGAPKSGSSNKDLGFVTYKCFSSNPLDSSNATSSSSSGSGLVEDMRPDSINHHQSSSKFLTLPTILTLARVAAVPILITTFYVDTLWGRTATTSIFIAAAFTDWLDGYIARKMRLGSVFGAFLDPVADKLMVATTLVLLCTKPLHIPMFGEVPWLLTIPAVAIIGREITMSAVREWAASQDSKLLEAVAVNNLGKWKTATQMIAMMILLATRESSLGNPGILVASGVGLLYTSAGLSLWSLAVYMRKISKVLLK